MGYERVKNLLDAARSGGFAVGAFNIENAEMAAAVMEAAGETGQPVILQTTPSTLRYLPPECFSAMVQSLAKRVRVPVALHLDHGSGIELCVRAFHAGYTGVMIDGSKLPLNENTALTRKVVHACGGIPVEGEMGCIGGKEDDTQAAARFTDPQEAKVFAMESGLYSLAIAVGTAHGVYGEKPALNYELIKEIRRTLPNPLVLHGASGLSGEQVQKCVGAGINKVNFATELRQAYTEGVRGALGERVFDPKVYGRSGMERVKNLCVEKIRLCMGK